MLLSLSDFIKIFAVEPPFNPSYLLPLSGELSGEETAPPFYGIILLPIRDRKAPSLPSGVLSHSSAWSNRVGEYGKYPLPKLNVTLLQLVSFWDRLMMPPGCIVAVGLTETQNARGDR